MILRICAVPGAGTGNMEGGLHLLNVCEDARRAIRCLGGF